MLNVNHLRQLPAGANPLYQQLETARNNLLAALHAAFPNGWTLDLSPLAEALSAMGAALAGAGATSAVLEWEAGPYENSESIARALLVGAVEAAPPDGFPLNGYRVRTFLAVKGVVSMRPDEPPREDRITLLDPVAWGRICEHVAAFGKEVLARLRPPGFSTTRPSGPTHSADFTMVNWFGVEYTFALGVQSRVVKRLWEEWEQNGLGLHETTLGDAVESDSKRFRVGAQFHGHPALGTMIQADGGGRYRLAPPSS